MPAPALPPVHVGRTDLPLKSSPADRGPLPLSTPTSAALPWRLLDGPPYANGPLHLGHALNKHVKDALARTHALRGCAVEWRPGWDCHGLPLELAVERTGAPRHQPATFLPAARAYARTQAQAQSRAFQDQGLGADWARPWTTMDPGMEAGTLRVLARLLEAGKLRVELAPVPWCPACQSTLAGAEQDDRPVELEAWVVPFPLAAPEGDVLLAWTTTPWTLPLNQALAVDPAARFVALEKPGAPRAWVSQGTAARWAQVLHARPTGQACLGADLAGQAYATPWSQGRVLADPAASADAGTGVLHVVHGLAQADTALARRHGLPCHPHLAADGCLTRSPCPAQVGLPAGPQASQAAHPAYAGNPWHAVQAHRTEQPHCWRHGVPVLTRPSRQVFLHLDSATRARARAMVQGMAFTPESARARLLAAMDGRPDWCLSRQRTWGVPLALFLDKATGQPHPRAAHWMRTVAREVEVRGVEAWWEDPSGAWLDPDVDPDTLERVDDVLDVWFDSGCLPQHLGPAAVVAEGVDQHRGWFQACVWVAAALEAPAPFARVVAHGFVVDATGAKLSKSAGGDAKAPAALHWSAQPTDVLRAWALAGAPGADKAFTPDALHQAQALHARLRGLVRFLLANAHPTCLPAASLPALPAWDRYWWHACDQQASAFLDDCATGHTGLALARWADFAEAFSAQAVGSWKDRLYCARPESLERRALDAVVKGCLQAVWPVVEVLAPRLAAHASSHLPPGLLERAGPVPTLSPSEAREVEAVRALRAALAAPAQELARCKVPPSARCLAWDAAPAWPGQLLADALDVGYLVPGTALPDAPAVEVPGLGLARLAPAPAPVCPRCRRAQPSLVAGACDPCARRTR